MTEQDVEVFKIAMRFIKDDLSNMSTVMMSNGAQDGSGSTDSAANGGSGTRSLHIA